ncbi:HAMP domain-containing sensor histidine kinase [Cellulomonas sp.]|uniref:sensor histidine kinase n=1 Tax=Cellulomonas sp. TaxID=40001 RepID=UPI0025840F9E|nr:HAMP domain-containing sensor histidine kinase [Cellulomonas sp.]MCR6688199.1 HAMP domain-containing histidine kinase [Cellulomonas sp.]
MTRPDPGPVPPPPVEAEPVAPGEPSRTVLRRWWSGVPLVGRLVSISAVLLALGLLLTGITATTLLQRNLVQQVDDKLRTEGVQLANASLNNNWDAQGPPTDYYGLLIKDGEPYTMFAPRADALADRGTPSLPSLTYRQAEARRGQQFTVSSDTGEHWRAVAYPVESTDWVVLIALPLSDVSETVEQMVLVLALSGAVILLAALFVGRWAVRRSLRPLTHIEHTAAAFAAGDFSQRVPAAPASTEVGRLGEALNGMLAQIEQAFAVRTASEARMRRFVADASHELRTPLAAIRGYGELYRMGALTSKDQVDDTMRRIESSATRMGSLVEDLLSLARLDERRPLRHDAVDLTVVAADAVSDLRALDPTRTARIVPLVPGGPTGPVVVDGDEARLRQVVANLVGNVVQHTPPGTAVEIAVGLHGGRDARPVGVVEVRDHGPGIDPEHAARVFERFYRVDASRGRDSGGAGLGMAIVAAIVTAHAGHVALAQTPGGGTTVRVEVPVTPTAAPAPGVS